MSKLQDNEIVRCGYCFTILNEPLFCKTITVHIFKDKKYNYRCPYVTCESCEYCSSCESQIRTLKTKLKQYRYGKEDEDKHVCEGIIERLKDSYGIEMVPKTH